MSDRTPHRTTDVSGSDEALRAGDTGLVVPVGDVPGLRAALRALCGDRLRAERLGRAGRTHMRDLAARHGAPRRQIEVWEELVRAAATGATPR
jgi:glycosyltransferase involved in cell wall biosynthesis